jgi:hypothetical protein
MMMTLKRNFGAELLEIAFVIYLQLQAYVREESSAGSCAVCHLQDDLGLSLFVLTRIRLFPVFETTLIGT